MGWRGISVGDLTAVDCVAIADPYDQDCDVLIFDRSNNPTVTDPILPKCSKPRPFKGLAKASWVIQGR